MKDTSFETQIISANPHSGDAGSSFVKSTMRKIRIQMLVAQPTARQSFWRRFARAHKFAFALIAIVVASVVGFSSYAYAIGSDPLALITRIVDNNHVKVNYEGRTFEYGKEMTYSDAAITAYAELNTVRDLDSRAAEIISAPKDGVEYVPNPLDKTWVSPMIGAVSSIDNDTVTLSKKYMLGDKIEASRDLDGAITSQMTFVHFYKDGNPATFTAKDKDQLVAIFTHKYVRHDLASNGIQQVTVYFVFGLSHSLADFKEADQNPNTKDVAHSTLYEPNWGGVSKLCVDNAGDTCDNDKLFRNNGQGLYTVNAGSKIAGGKNDILNPNTSVFDDAYLLTDTPQSTEWLQRNIQGTITKLDDSSLTLRTSSGTVWNLAYSSAQRQAFDNTHANNHLKVGDIVGGGVFQSIYDLNNHNVQDRHILSLMRL